MSNFAHLVVIFARNFARNGRMELLRKHIGLDLHAITSMEIRAGSTGDTRRNLFSLSPSPRQPFPFLFLKPLFRSTAKGSRENS